jgi:glutathione S-transferase
MRLISLPVSPYAARVRIAIYAKDLDVTLVAPPLGWPNAAHRRLGPVDRVPVLLCEDGAIPESQVIVEYLEERFPNARRLLPPTARARAQARLIARVVDLYLMPPIVSLANVDRTDEEQIAEREAVSAALDVVDDLLGSGRCAVGDELSLADCALAPALFAAGVTGRRYGFDILAERESLKRYAATIAEEAEVNRVLLEMAEGLRRLEGI